MGIIIDAFITCLGFVALLAGIFGVFIASECIIALVSRREVRSLWIVGPKKAR